MLKEKLILVVEDEPIIQQELVVILNFLGEIVETISYSDWRNQVEELPHRSDQIRVVFFGGSKNDVIPLENEARVVHERLPNTPVIIIGPKAVDTSSWNTAVARRIVGQLETPVTYNSLVDALHRAQLFLEAHILSRQGAEVRPVHLFRSLVGTSREIHNVRQMMGQVADSDVTALILGQSGTGKEVVARNLHYHSVRREKPFVPVNCGAIPAELLESELFGHEKGAFTGALTARAGRFEMAEGGTLFLDEIGDMPLNMQVKLLRVLQEKSYERVGGNKTYQTDVRIVAATHCNLEQMIETGGFREDLYYRLNVFPIEMPSLSERSEDIPLLINELVARLESEKRASIRFNSAAILSLCQHRWPGNVRELANLVERMAIMHPFGVIGIQDLPNKYRHIEVEEDLMIFEDTRLGLTPSILNVNQTTLLPEEGIDLKEYITGLEQSLIKQALDDSGGVVARAAERLTIRRTTLVEKMRKYGMQR